MVSLKLMTSLAFQCLRYIFLRNYLNIQYQWGFLKLYSSFVIKKNHHALQHRNLYELHLIMMATSCSI